MRNFMKSALIMSAMIFTAPAMANSQQFALIKKAIIEDKIYAYSTPTFKRLVDKANKFYDGDDPDGSSLPCMTYLLSYHGNGGFDPHHFKNFKFQTGKNGNVRVTFIIQTEYYTEQQVGEFKMVYQNKRWLIDDFNGEKEYAKKVIREQGCA